MAEKSGEYVACGPRGRDVTVKVGPAIGKGAVSANPGRDCRGGAGLQWLQIGWSLVLPGYMYNSNAKVCRKKKITRGFVMDVRPKAGLSLVDTIKTS